jgi:hypothetical protein
MNKLARVGFAVFGTATLLLAFILDAKWATGLSPWDMSRLSRLFIASILAAIGAPVIGVAISGELAAVTAGAVNLFVTNCGIAAALFKWSAASSEPGNLRLMAFIFVLFAIVTGALFLWGRTLKFEDRRPLPRLIYWYFLAAAAILILVGSALVTGRPYTFPWMLSRELSVIFGWIFLGASCYFMHAVFVPVWGNVKGQLLGFLAYDLVLLVPFIQHFQSVSAPMFMSHVVYVTVVVTSGIMSVYYIFVTRDAWPFR